MDRQHIQGDKHARPSTIGRRKRLVRNEGIGEDEISGRDVKVWGGGGQDEQESFTNEVPKPDQFQKKATPREERED